MRSILDPPVTMRRPVLRDFAGRRNVRRSVVDSLVQRCSAIFSARRSLHTATPLFPRVRPISSISGSAHRDKAETPVWLLATTTSPACWQQSLRRVAASGQIEIQSAVLITSSVPIRLLCCPGRPRPAKPVVCGYRRNEARSSVRPEHKRFSRWLAATIPWTVSPLRFAARQRCRGYRLRQLIPPWRAFQAYPD